MRVYLIQHGKPVPKEDNPDRPLSDLGMDDVNKMAVFLEKCGVRVEGILHSGKTRARQTAEIMGSKLNPDRGTIQENGLSPMDDVRGITDQINRGEKDLMIVGHLPHLAKLTSRLVTGGESPPVVGFQQGGVLCLDNSSGSWVIAWMLVPEII